MPVLEAIYNRDLRYVEQYLTRGGNPNFRDEWGSTLLHVAIRVSDINIVDILLRKSANVHLEDAYGNTPLHIACIYGERTAAQLLVAHGAHVDGTSPRRTWTPLMLALNEEKIELAEWLMER
ncbi:MAG: ankyrin repeat domain-containing protein, partial [Bacteroidota bacterium]